MYSEKVMDHFANPRNSGIIENASGEGTVGNPTCGDLMTIYIDVDDNDVIQDIKFETFGCGAAIATSSMITEIAKGMTVDEATSVLEKYLDDAYLSSLHEVRIVHGKGTGLLRKGVQSYLKTNPHVKSFRLGMYGEGDSGV
ncbi:MAG: iron-sulfur cluster assembly scaffold protein, partial [Methanobrevibacter sp.]|nr:iron-sulfur cluster assembly scaffold protein [Methanobrevibacter sp.]